RGSAVADPLPQRDGPLDLRTADESIAVELLGLEADGAHVVATPGRLVALHEVGQRRAAVAGHAGGDSVNRESYCFFGEEHERRVAGFGGAHGDQESDGDLLQVLEPGGEADDCL